MIMMMRDQEEIYIPSALVALINLRATEQPKVEVYVSNIEPAIPLAALKPLLIKLVTL